EPCGGFLESRRIGEHAFDVPPLGLLEWTAAIGGRLRHRRRRRRGVQAVRKVFDTQSVAATDHDRVLEHVDQLAYVPRPAIASECRFGVRFDLDFGSSVACRMHGQDVTREGGQVFKPLAKRRQLDVYDVETIEKIFPKGTTCDI